MARAASPFYYGNDAALGATLGQSLGRALFGDPEAAAQLALRKAQMENYDANAEESRAHAGLYTEQTGGAHTQNAAAASLPDLIRSMFQTAAPPPAPTPAAAGPVDPLAPLPEVGAASPAPGAVTFDAQTYRNGLPALMAALAQVQGDKVDPNKVIGGLAAMMGSDEFARRGLVSMGSTPGKEFAITPDRADEIAAQGYTAEYNRGTDEARINHASDIPVADIQAATARRGQDVGASTTRRGQDIEHGDRVRGQNIDSGDKRYATDVGAGGLRVGGWTPRFRDGGDNSDAAVDGKIAVMQQRLGAAPDQAIDRAHLPAVFDAIAASEGANPHNNNPGNIIDGPFARSQAGYAGPDGNGFARFTSAAAGRQAGISLLGVYYNRGQRSIRDIVEGVPAPPKPSAKQPSPISAADSKLIDDEIKTQLQARGIAGQPDPGTMVNIRNAAQLRYQKSGNPADAVSATLDQLQRRFAAKQGGSKKASGGNLRAQANAAISKGAPRTQVAARFKQMTGQEL